MNNLRDKKSNPVITLIVVVISLFFLPAIAAGLGTMGEIYIDGLRELPSFGIKAISVAIWMLLVAYLMCCFMKAKKDFIRLPAILTFIGTVLLPFVSSFQKMMIISGCFHQSAFLSKVTEGLGTMKSGFMFIVPALLCAIASIMLAVGMINILRNRYMGR